MRTFLSNDKAKNLVIFQEIIVPCEKKISYLKKENYNHIADYKKKG